MAAQADSQGGERLIVGSARMLVVADSSRARLFAGGHTRYGRLHLDELAVLEHPASDRQHDRPSARAGRSGHSYASPSHEHEEHARRSVKSLLAWLELQVGHRAGRVVVFAPPRYMGLLRDLPHDGKWLTLVEADLTSFSASELAHHALIVQQFVTE